MIRALKNFARACFPEHFEKKRIRLLNARLAEGVIVYRGANITNSNVRDAVTIGQGSHLAGMLFATDKGHISVGRQTFIGEYSRVYSTLKVTIGDHVQIAHNVNIFDNNIHSLDPVKRQEEFIVNTSRGLFQTNDWGEKEVVIEDNVWIGAGSIILKGVTIGHNTVVGAGSVVAKSLPPNVLAVGNPARIVRTLFFAEGKTPEGDDEIKFDVK